MSQRDDFTVKVKSRLAERVGMRCSNPACCKPTSGPRSDPSNAINIGVAAHITAASPGGPRYDASLLSNQRNDISNGIWLCQNCAKLVDNDPIRYGMEILQEWKKVAEAKALENVEGIAAEAEQSELLQRLEQLLNKFDDTGTDDDSPQCSYHVTVDRGPEHLNPEPNTLHSKRMKTGHIVNYMVRNKMLMCEIIYPDGKSLVADITAKRIHVHHLPSPLEEMRIEVEPQYLLSTKKSRLPDGNRIVTRQGKWGFKVQTVENATGQILQCYAEYAVLDIPSNSDVVAIKPEND